MDKTTTDVPVDGKLVTRLALYVDAYQVYDAKERRFDLVFLGRSAMQAMVDDAGVTLPIKEIEHTRGFGDERLNMLETPWDTQSRTRPLLAEAIDRLSAATVATLRNESQKQLEHG